MSRYLATALVLSAWIAAWTPAPAGAAGGVDPALAWLREQQQDDGGFSNGFSAESDPAATADAVVAIVSGGERPSAWRAAGLSPLDYLEAHVGEGMGAGLAAKTALAVIAAGRDPAAFGGVDLLQEISAGFDPATGWIGTGPYESALGILALELSGRKDVASKVVPAAIQALVRSRQADGSYAFDGSTTPGTGDSNTTAVVVQALLVAGAAPETIPSYQYFRRAQNGDGGWTYQKPSAFGEATDANSTALVVQALLAGGQDLSEWGRPLEVLAGLQQASGALRYNPDTPGDNFLATVQAIPALAGVDLTDLARPTSPARAPANSDVLAAGLVVLSLVVIVALLGSAVEEPRRTAS